MVVLPRACYILPRILCYCHTYGYRSCYTWMNCIIFLFFSWYGIWNPTLINADNARIVFIIIWLDNVLTLDAVALVILKPVGRVIVVFIVIIILQIGVRRFVAPGGLSVLVVGICNVITHMKAHILRSRSALLRCSPVGDKPCRLRLSSRSSCLLRSASCASCSMRMASSNVNP